MSKIIEEGERKAARRAAGEIAMNLLKNGRLSHKQISEVTDVPIEVV